MISVIAASVAVAVALVSAVLARLVSVRSRRRLEAFIGELDQLLAGVSRILEQTLRRSEVARAEDTFELGLTLDLDELLGRLAEEAATRTGAQAAAVRVRGPGDEPAVGCFGSEEVAELLEATLRPPDRRPFRTLTINWTFPPTLEPESDGFRSALIVPVVEDGLETGAIAGYAREPAAFRPEHASALESLAAEASAGIAMARRFTAMRLRAAAGRREETMRPENGPEPSWGDGSRRTDEPGDARS